MIMDIAVGKVFTPAARMGEGCIFNIDMRGATLVYAFKAPTREEVIATKSGQAFEIRFAVVDGIIWVTSKCGGLEWVDAPYNPRLSTFVPAPETITDGVGLTTVLAMADSRSGIVQSARLIGLGTEFSRNLLRVANEERAKSMTVREAELNISKAMDKYSTIQLADMAKPENRFKL